jgi:two-component system, NarL family, nitrate/nitrite response regulator NarL
MFMPSRSPDSNPIHIVIADDHPIFRDGLRRLIEHEPDFELAGEAGDGIQTIELVRKTNPDLLLLDVAMPKMSGIEVLRKISTMQLPTKTILLTAAIEEEQITEALRMGARGVVMKDAATQLLAKSIRCVMDGEYWVGRGNVSGLVQALQAAHSSPPGEANSKRYGLTGRELDIVAAIVEGLTNKEIAQKFSISEQTVKHHLSSVFDKVGVSNRLELALFSVAHRLLEKAR